MALRPSLIICKRDNAEKAGWVDGWRTSWVCERKLSDFWNADYRDNAYAFWAVSIESLRLELENSQVAE